MSGATIKRLFGGVVALLCFQSVGAADGDWYNGTDWFMSDGACQAANYALANTGATCGGGQTCSSAEVGVSAEDTTGPEFSTSYHICYSRSPTPFIAGNVCTLLSGDVPSRSQQTCTHYTCGEGKVFDKVTHACVDADTDAICEDARAGLESAGANEAPVHWGGGNLSPDPFCDAQSGTYCLRALKEGTQLCTESGDCYGRGKLTGASCTPGETGVTDPEPVDKGEMGGKEVEGTGVPGCVYIDGTLTCLPTGPQCVELTGGGYLCRGDQVPLTGTGQPVVPGDTITTPGGDTYNYYGSGTINEATTNVINQGTSSCGGVGQPVCGADLGEEDEDYPAPDTGLPSDPFGELDDDPYEELETPGSASEMVSWLGLDTSSCSAVVYAVDVLGTSYDWTLDLCDWVEDVRSFLLWAFSLLTLVGLWTRFKEGV